MAKDIESRCHKEAVECLLSILKDVRDIRERLHSQLAIQHKEREDCFLQILKDSGPDRDWHYKEAGRKMATSCNSWCCLITVTAK